MRKWALQRPPRMCLDSCWLKHPPSQQKRRQLRWKINNAHAGSISTSRILHGLYLNQKLLIACRKWYLYLCLFNYTCIYVSIICLPELSIYLFSVCLYVINTICYLSFIIYQSIIYVCMCPIIFIYVSIYVSFCHLSSYHLYHLSSYPVSVCLLISIYLCIYLWRDSF